MRLVHNVDQRTDGAGPDMDQVAFRVRAERVSSPCDLVASGMFFEDASSTKPTPFSLLVDDGSKGLRRFGNH